MWIQKAIVYLTKSRNLIYRLFGFESFSQLSSDEFDSKWFDLKCRIRGRIRSLNSDLKKFYSQFCPNVGQICLKNDFFWPYSAFEYLKFKKSNKFVRADKSQPHQKYFLKKRFLFSSNLKFHFLLESQRKKYHWCRWSSLFEGCYVPRISREYQNHE